MRCLLRAPISTLRATFTLLAIAAAAACSTGTQEAGATGTAGSAEAPFAIQISQTYITVENRTGGPVVGGEMQIIPAGVLPPFKATLPYLETGSKRDIVLNTFRSNDGTPFSRAITRARRVRVTAKDRAGTTYAHEVPFN